MSEKEKVRQMNRKQRKIKLKQYNNGLNFKCIFLVLLSSMRKKKEKKRKRNTINI